MEDNAEGLYYNPGYEGFYAFYFVGKNKYLVSIVTHSTALTLYLLTWRIWSAPNNANKRQLGFNLTFRWLNIHLNYNRSRKSNLVNKANLVQNFS